MELIIIFILAFSFLMLLFSITCAIIFIDNYENLWIDPKPNKKYSITAIIPAYNEEESIKKTVMSIYIRIIQKSL
jgi:cellulose synthase/poly-beta-1,6-N-acetylglucosamine synthase-like glycosyltransferase